MPRKTSSKPRPPERDYSHRSLLDKLGVKPGQKIQILGVNDGAFINDIQPFNPEFAERKPAADIDLIFFNAEQKKDLARLAQLRKSITKNGGIWVIYPKGRQDIRELDVITAGKAAGLTDNKVCGFSITHTALLRHPNSQSLTPKIFTIHYAKFRHETRARPMMLLW